MCLILLPLNSYWVVQMEIVRYSAHPTTISLFFNAVFILLCLTLVNRAVARWRPGFALCRGELLLTYSIVCIGSGVSGHDMLQVLTPMLTWSFRFANSSNQWNSLINSHLPRALFITNPRIYTSYYLGNDTIWRLSYIRAWLPVVLIWTLFITLLLLGMLSINAIIRKQWTDNERLTYPIVQLPLQITGDAAFAPGGIFRSRLFWVGFLIAGSIDTINSLNYYYPFIPTIFTPGFGQSFFDLHQFFPNKPWNAIDWTPISFYPFMIGLGMFMPLDFLFSAVFFYWFWKLEKVYCVAMGYDRDPRFPYMESQAFGAYAAFCVYSVWLSRRYLKQVFLRVIGRPSSLDDTHEPMRYRTACLGIAAAFTGLLVFSIVLGLTWWVAVICLIIYFALALAITRMRAELGTPVHDLHQTGPELILTRVAGSRSFDANNLTGLAMYFAFNRAYRGHPMPHQLEGLKVAEQSGGEYRKWTGAMLVLGSVAVFVAFWTILGLMYRYGAQAKSVGGFGPEAFDMLTTWLKTPQRARFGDLMAMSVGLVAALTLQGLRVRFPWWPLHPLAFAVTSSWEINLVWFPLFLAWVFKSTILRYGGRRGFHRALPFFIGLILGQFVVGSLLNIYGIARGLPTYQFWQ